jgi:hypothetical protein
MLVAKSFEDHPILLKHRHAIIMAVKKSVVSWKALLLGNLLSNIDGSTRYYASGDGSHG